MVDTRAQTGVGVGEAVTSDGTWQSSDRLRVGEGKQSRYHQGAARCQNHPTTTREQHDTQPPITQRLRRVVRFAVLKILRWGGGGDVLNGRLRPAVGLSHQVGRGCAALIRIICVGASTVSKVPAGAIRTERRPSSSKSVIVREVRPQAVAAFHLTITPIEFLLLRYPSLNALGERMTGRLFITADKPRARRAGCWFCRLIFRDQYLRGSLPMTNVRERRRDNVRAASSCRRVVKSRYVPSQSSQTPIGLLWTRGLRVSAFALKTGGRRFRQTVRQGAGRINSPSVCSLRFGTASSSASFTACQRRSIRY